MVDIYKQGPYSFYYFSQTQQGGPREQSQVFTINTERHTLCECHSVMDQGGNQNFSQPFEDCCLPTGLVCKQRGWEKCYPSVIKHSQKANLTLWEVNFQCTKFHLVPCRKDSCKEYLAIRSSSFIGEHSIIKAPEWKARSSSSQAITVYNSKSDGYYQSLKDSPETAFL